MIEIHPHVWLFEEATAPLVCGFALNWLSDVEWTEAAPGKHISDQPAKSWKRIRDAFLLAGNHALEIYRNYDTNNQIPLLELETLRFTRYQTGAGFPSHFDSSVLSSVLYLNDDYEGGDLSYPYHPESMRRMNAGDIVVHPGIFTHPHEAAPVTKGEKFICSARWGFTPSPFVNWVPTP